MSRSEPEVELEVTGLAAGGDGVGRDAGGRVTFVAGAAPDERVIARVVETHRSFARAVLVRVVRASPVRVTPPCPLAGGACGGCPWMHVARDAQAAAKQAIAAAALRGLIARGLALAPIATPVPPLGWRRRVRLHVDGARMGFHGARSHAIADVATCPQLDPRLDRAIAAVRGGLRGGRGTVSAVVGHQGDVHVARDGDVALDARALIGKAGIVGGGGEGARDVELEPGLRAAADDFAQASDPGNAALVAEVVREVAPAPGLRVLELFGGGGNFTRALLVAGASVTVNDLRPPRALPAGATFEGGPAEAAVARLGGGFDVVLLDPPRTGALAAVRALAGWAERPRVVYVACDAATLARDLAILADAGWAPERAQVLDLFPQTAHLEIVATLSTGRASGGSTTAEEP